MCYYAHIFFCPAGCTCCVEVEPRLQKDLCWTPGVTRPEHCWDFKPAVTLSSPEGRPECGPCLRARWAREEAELMEFVNSVGWVTKSGKQ